MKKIFLILLLFVSAVFAQSKIVISNIAKLKDAVNTASPGDTIQIKNGKYDTGGSVRITNSGTTDKPIVIAAESVGEVELTGDSYFDFRQCANIVLEGIKFTSTDYTVIKLQACNNIRITRNIFKLKETSSLKWILIGGVWNDPAAMSSYNRIDHNLFEGKTQPGNFITIDGSPEPTYKSSQHDRIDHNHFKNNNPRAVNEKESIRIGWSELSMSSGNTTVEYNLFEDCNGDPEIISVKTCDDTVRYNTFRRCQGTLSLRHGNRSVVNNNYFFGDGVEGTGGIRIYGDDHKIYNNYFEGLKGTKWDAPITLTNGDYDGGSSYSKHFRINRATIVYNTLIYNDHAFEIGYTNNGNYSKPPRDVVIANNLVVADKNKIVDIITQPINMKWSCNIFYTENSAEMGADFTEAMVLNTDPAIIKNNDLWFLSETSAAINKSAGDYTFVVNDIHDQTRNAVYDVGADEYSTDEIYNLPLTEQEVGPFARTVTTVENNINSVPKSIILSQNYPNPFNPISNINYNINDFGHVKISVYDVLGKEVLVLVDEVKSPGYYNIIFSGVHLTSGVYFYRLISGENIFTRKMILLK